MKADPTQRGRRARMLKVMTILGTRPELIKLSVVLKEASLSFKHVLVHTGQNYAYELNKIFFDEMRISAPDYYLGAVADRTATTIGNIIARGDEVMEKEKPDALLVYGDTNSCLAVIAAKRRKIPVFHMEAGNRCFDERVPEEINRRIIDHVSDINMTLTEHARRYLISEGLRPETVIKVGSSMREVLDYYAKDIESSNVLDRLGLQSHRYFVVSAHREENVDYEQNLRRLVETVNHLAGEYGMPVIFSAHPRTMAKLVGIDAQFHSLVRVGKPLGFFDYIRLQMNSHCVLSDSGTITEESSVLGFPAVTIRYSHERPEGMDAGTLIMCGLEKDKVSEAIGIVTRQSGEGYRPEMVLDYYPADVSKKTVRIIESYVGYVRRTVWRE
jgi:UDP-N-acetylglucosamine 2-epimerase (non-hydrolysing)